MVAPNVELKSTHGHTLYRFFLGPLPERVVSDAQHLVTKSVNRPRGFFGFTQAQPTSSEADEPVEELINQYAYAFYLKLGGSEEDWNEEQENYVKNEMSRRWKESAWGRLWHRRKENPVTAHARWVLPNDAGFFQVGEFLGLNTYAEPTSRGTRLTPSSSARTGPSSSPIYLTDPSAVTRDSFVSARSHPEPETVPTQSSSLPPDVSFSSNESYDIHAITSSTNLIPVNTAHRPSERHHTCTGPTDAVPSLKPALRVRALTQVKSDSAVDGTTSATLGLSGSGKGKAKKAVRLPSDPLHSTISALPPPVSPRQVLERAGSELQRTSAAMEEQLQTTNSASAWSLEIPDEYDDAKMKDLDPDRMVVRIAYSRDGSLGPSFDEMQNRSARNLQYEDWTEFVVVWRKDRLELYDDYRLPCREWLAGHKHLAFVVPLKNVRTKLSLYSFTDMSFCIICPPASLSPGMKTFLPSQRKTGTNVFVFKARCRSRAIDWIWRLWRDLGGSLPTCIEVRSPVLDTRMKIDIPESADYSIFSHDNLVALCMKTLSSVQDWDVIIKNRLAEGAHMELAWRLDTNLDWVRWPDDIHGNPRTWAVLAGLALNQAGRAAHLEVRLAEHMASQLHMKNDHRLSEPPSVEGYVSRVKPGSGSREEVYLTVHNGLLFTLAPAGAHAPNPPGVVPALQDSDRDARTLRQEEIRRGAAQVLAARGVIDLRAVIAVRRAFRPVLHPNEHVNASTQPEIDGFVIQEEEVVEESDTRDDGGDAGLTDDVTTMRMRRCFELVMKSGLVIRFETWSAKVAIEWIGRLRALIRYWKLRHVVDTRQEMDVVHFATGRPRITPQRLRHEEDDKARPLEPQSDPAVVLPYLSSIYHGCVYEGCRPIVKAGRIFVRQGLHGRYKLVQLFLVASQLVQFHIKPKSTDFRKRGKPVSLLDAYIISGVFAAQALPKGQYNPNNPITPRLYADGLECDDSEENTLFTVYYVSRKSAQAEKVPPLNAAKKMMVFRCRSRVERDLWCWAMNTEIEKLARKRRDREELRNAGAPISLGTGDEN